MGKIVTFVNEKGGIGKTSCCFNMAWELANKKKKILMIDLDGQKASLTYFAGIKDEVRDEAETICEVIRGKRSFQDVTMPLKEPYLYIVPSNIEVAGINQTAKITVLKKALEDVAGAYDFIFIDVGPSPTWNQYMAVCCSDFLIIPMLADMTSLKANVGIAETIFEVQRTMNPDLKVLGILINDYNGRTRLAKSVHDEAEKMCEALHTRLFGTMIRHAVVLSENVATSTGITDYAPSSGAAEDVRNVVKEFLREVKKNA